MSLLNSTSVQLELPPKLIPVFIDKPGEIVRFRGAWGGRGSAKTRSFAKMTAVVGRKLGLEGREGVILCAREFLNSLEDSSLEEVKAAIRSEWWLEDYWEIGEKFIRSKDGRIRYVFSGLRHNVDSIKSKARILLCWIDEAEPTREESYRKLIPTVREDGSEIWLTWNPEHDDSATHKRFRVDPPPYSKIVELNYRDNPWFPATLERDRQEDELKRPDTYDHIWEGAFLDLTEASYYARWIKAAEDEGRVRPLARIPHRPVSTSWDIGVDDYTAVWVWQEDGVNAYVLDFYEASGDGAQQIVEDFLRPKGYVEGRHYLPHDVKNREWGSGARSRYETLRGLGLKDIRIGAAMNPEDRIEAVRALLPLVHFNNTREVAVGLAHLRRYSRRFNAQMGTYMGPLHDVHSHANDALGEFAINGPIRPEVKREAPEPQWPLHASPGTMPGVVLATFNPRKEIEGRAKRRRMESDL